MTAGVRLEYKYLVPNTLLDVIRRELAPFMDRDRYAVPYGRHGYTVRSIYYDTQRMTCYHQKVEGLRTRKKFRIRGYDRATEDALVFLEIKRKRINFIAKNRAPLRWSLAPAILDSHQPENMISPPENGTNSVADAESFLYYYHRFGLVPTVLVVYDREAFQGRFDRSLRITFDKNLRSAPFPRLDSLFDPEPLCVAMRDHFVMEVKFHEGLPRWVRSLIERHQLPRMALSKYTICLDSHRRCNRSRWWTAPDQPIEPSRDNPQSEVHSV